MTDLSAYNTIDKALLEAAIDVKPLYYVNPTNGPEEKIKFFQNVNQNPSFTYRPLEYNPQNLVETLQKIIIPDDQIGGIFKEKKQETLLKNEIIQNRGNEELVKRATEKLYGMPSKELVLAAQKILKNIHNERLPKTTPSSDIKASLEEGLQQYGLTEWVVEFSNKRLTTIYAAEKKITVCENREFAALDKPRLKVHEVGVHALRAANGFNQDLNIFATGLPGYLPTEEGMATYFEQQTNTSSPEILRDYAARVIAVNSVCEGNEFKKTYNILRNYDLTEDQAWNLSVRAHRAGGFIKDHVYLQGKFDVEEFAQEGDLSILYVGKIGLCHIPLVQELLDENTLKRPAHLPTFLN